jgi:hypothetical protein
MEVIIESAEQGKGNEDVIKEFEKFFMDKPEYNKFRNDIRGMVFRTLIPSYESMFTEDEVLGELKFMIYTIDREWNRVQYPEFKKFLLSNAQNIIKKESDRLKSQYGIVKNKKKDKPENENKETPEENSQANCGEQEENGQEKDVKTNDCIDVNNEEYDEENQVKNVKEGENCFHDGITLYTAKPRNYFYNLEHFTENEIDEVEKDPSGKKEDKLFDMRSFTEQNDLSQFEGTVAVILQGEKDSKLLAVFEGKMDGKSRCLVMKECNMSKAEYNNAYRRLLYRLRKELPPQYKSMIVSSLLTHLLMYYLYKINSYLF